MSFVKPLLRSWTAMQQWHMRLASERVVKGPAVAGVRGCMAQGWQSVILW